MKGSGAMRGIGTVLVAAWLAAPMALAATTPPADGPDKPGPNAEQREKMKALRKEHRQAMQPLHKQLRLQTDELRVLLDKDASDSQLSAKLDEIRKTRKAIQEMQAKFMEQEAALLTVRERAEMAVRMGDRQNKPPREGRPGGRNRSCGKPAPEGR